MKETVVVIDGGGRGASLVDGYAKSPHVGGIIAIPGNDLMEKVSDKRVTTIPGLNTTSIYEITEICKYKKVSLVDVAQDNAVAAGLVDALENAGIKTVGPRRLPGEIEWSKLYCRRLGEKVGLLQPKYRGFEKEQCAAAFLNNQEDQKWFLKADGLAEGKGVISAKSTLEAIKNLPEIRRFTNGGKLLLEEWLEGDDGTEGEEFSSFYISDGESIRHLGDAQDHKRVFNFDEGENTGGMGCSSPPLVLTPELQSRIRAGIFEKIFNGLPAEGRLYKGVLYLGGMLVRREGVLKPYVVEFNARWGDPEAQVLVPGIQTDLFELGMAVAEGKLDQIDIQRDNKSRVVVAGVSKGYPGDYSHVKGKEIFGLEDALNVSGVKVYGAGVKVNGQKNFASGGRLFYIIGEGASIIEARDKAYQAMEFVQIEGDNLHYRTDIGWRDVQRLRSKDNL
jgi:phosphoribosylamine---glycine ligase